MDRQKKQYSPAFHASPSPRQRPQLRFVAVPLYFLIIAAVSVYIYIYDNNSIFFTILFIIFSTWILLVDKSWIGELMNPFGGCRYQYMDQRFDDTLTHLFATLGYFSLLFSILIPASHIVSTGLAVLFPVLSVVRYFWKKDIRFGSPNKSRLSVTADSLFMSGIILCVFSIYNHEYPVKLWLYVTIVTVVLTVLFLILKEEYLQKQSIALGFVVCTVIFSFSAVCTLNRDYDFFLPKVYTVMVVDKTITDNRNHIKTVTVSPWLSGQKDTDIEVDFQTYNKMNVGEIGYVIQHRGLFNIGWYEFEPNVVNNPINT